MSYIGGEGKVCPFIFWGQEHKKRERVFPFSETERSFTPCLV